MQEGDEAPPKEFRIFKSGTIETAKGIHKFSAASQSSVMESAKQYGNDFVIDYCHAAHSFLSVDPAESGKAAGWFTPKVKAGELWATNCRWTKKATQMLVDREYRYFSPVFAYSQDGEIRELRSVGLTNLPATYGQEPLMASQVAQHQSNHSQPLPEESTVELDQLIAQLSLNENASEAEVTKAITKLIAQQAQLQSLAQLTQQQSVEGMLGTITAWKTAAEQVPTLTAKLSAIETEAKASAIKAIVEKGTREGRIPPALAQQMLAAPNVWTPETVNAYLSAAPVMPQALPSAREPNAITTGGIAGTGSIVQGANGTVQVELSQEERQIAGMMGTPVQAVAQRKAAVAGFVVAVPAAQSAQK